MRMVWGCERGICGGIDQGMSWSRAVKGSRGRRGRKSSEVMSEEEPRHSVVINRSSLVYGMPWQTSNSLSPSTHFKCQAHSRCTIANHDSDSWATFTHNATTRINVSESTLNIWTFDQTKFKPARNQTPNTRTYMPLFASNLQRPPLAPYPDYVIK